VATVITRPEGGLLGRLAAHHGGVSRIVKSHYGFPFHEFGPAPPPPAYVTIECRPGRLTDATLCVRTAVAVEELGRGLAVLERVRVAMRSQYGLAAGNLLSGWPAWPSPRRGSA
jgi:hypothetical protein